MNPPPIPHPRTPGHHTYLHHNLRLVTAKIKTRAPGIRTCPDCHQPWINDDSGLVWCPNCRINHLRTCRHCRMAFTNTPDGDRLCECCRHQHSLF